MMPNQDDDPRPAENRLTAETSPYLLQHAYNPVDWYPWGAEALERARTEDLPILLSIGYSACHWCHVMAHESFEDAATARIMNERFINIKVDREERPDVDSIYMSAVQQMTGHGGWPLTAFLTPDGVPFFGGTYFPPAPRHGMPSFRDVLLGVSQAYRERRDEVEQSAAELHQALRQSVSLRAPAPTLDASILDRATATITARFDARQGGFGAAPKFPQPLTLEFLLRQAHHSTIAGREAEGALPSPLSVVDTTLRAMAGGGIYDHLGGGFHRYSVDARWLVPHFEKMLYDNALLARVYLHVFQITGALEHRQVAEETLRYVQREMRSPEGGFFSAQDADSEGVEGKFYVWTPDQVDELLGPEDGPLFRRFYDVTPEGNWEGDPHAPSPQPTSILHAEHSIDAVALEAGIDPERLREVLRRGRERLYEARARRVRPSRDDKILTSWNAMMLHSFAEAARVLDNRDFEQVSVANAEFLLTHLRRNGVLLRSYKDGVAKIHAFLEDHALLMDALFELYQTTGNARWVREAIGLADTILERFWDDEEGVFYDAPIGGETLVVRPRDLYDNPTPSGTSAAVLGLLRLAALVGEPRYERIAARALEGMGRLMAELPSGFAHLLSALDFYLAAPREVAIVGPRHRADTGALLDVLRARYLPNTVLALLDPAAPGEAAEMIPLLANREMRNKQATAYVCERFACRQPITEPEELAAELDGG